MATGKYYPYVIVLKNDHVRLINIIALMLTIGSAAFFIMEMIVRKTIVLPWLAGLVFLGILFAWNLYQFRKTRKRVYFSKALLITGLVWTKMPYLQWLVFIFAVLALLEYQAKLSPEIGFSDDHIVFNRLLRKKFSWDEIEHVILRDGLLTIGFKNNRFFQKEIDSEEYEATEKEFNDWCTAKLGHGQMH